MPTQAETTAYLEAIRHMPPGSTLTIDDVSWAEYEALLAELGDGHAVRIAYDHGRMEIVSPSRKHEIWKEFTLSVARVLADELGTELESHGSTTFKRQDLKRGAEPDTCFYVQRASEVIGRNDEDPAAGPPPDVIVEVDVSHSSGAKRTFYAEMGVPELWGHDGQRARFYQLDGQDYREIAGSTAFPGFSADTLTALIDELNTQSQQKVLQAFRRSLRGPRS